MATQLPLRTQWGTLTLTEDTGVGPAWTNGMDIPSQTEWPYIVDGHFKLNDIFNSLFYAGLNSSVMLTVTCVLCNVNMLS